MADRTLVLVGNLTADPEVRKTQSGTSVCNFSIASTERRRKDDGSFEDGDTLFVRCTLWRDYGEHVGSSLRKGNRVIVMGQLHPDDYEKDGTMQRGFRMDVDEVGATLRFALLDVHPIRQGQVQQSSGRRSALSPVQ